jgi:hypothetical protein
MKIILFVVFQFVVTIVADGQNASTEFRGVEVKLGDTWVKQESGVPPVNKDTVLFHETIISKIEYPRQALRMGIEGDVDCIIELNESGEIVEYVIKDIGSGTRESIAKVLKALPAKWTPAVVNDKAVKSRISVLFKFHLDVLNNYTSKDKYRMTYLVMATGGGKWTVIDAKKIGSKSR